MASQTDIYNQALTIMGEELVVGPSDTSTAAKTLNAVYDLIRLGELRRYRWKFSLTRTVLPALTNPPANTPYAYGYQLPPNCLKVLDINGLRQDLGCYNYRSGLEKLYEFQGSVLLTMIAAPITLHYVQDVTSTTAFDPLFINALSAALARKTAYRLTQSNSIVTLCEREYKKAMAEATMMDAIEKLPEGQAESSFILSRL